MRSEDVIHYMACDISQWITHFVPDWEYPDEPGDAYTDTVRVVFGDVPDERSVRAAYKSGQAAVAIRTDLNTGWETSLITPEVATQLIERLLLNYLGPDALK